MTAIVEEPRTHPTGLPLGGSPGRELHISDHSALLTDRRVELARRAGGRGGSGARRLTGLDAIIVPTSRRDPNLSLPLARAAEAGCPLVVLTSGRARAADVLAKVRRGRAPVCVVDVGDGGDGTVHPVAAGYGNVGLWLETDQLAADLDYEGDVGFKRNVGLLIARAMGWRTVLFLDDDLFGLDSDVLAPALDLLNDDAADHTAAVSWKFDAFADNSSVCHAYRLTGGRQGVFVGAAALLVRTDDDLPFFPSVYNEDWLFHFPLLARRRLALAGTLGQLPYDPYDPGTHRAARQEFGDTLAESLFRLLHENPDGAHVLERACEVGWWKDMADRRQQFLLGVHRGLVDADASVRVILSVLEAMEAQLEFTPEDLAAFVGAWLRDSRNWRATLGSLAPEERRPLHRLRSVVESFGVGDVHTLRTNWLPPRLTRG